MFLFVNIFPIKDIEMSGARQRLRSQSSLSWARPQVPASHWSSWPQYWPLIGPDVATQPLSTNRKAAWGQGGDQVQIFCSLDLMKISKGNTFSNDFLIFDIDELFDICHCQTLYNNSTCIWPRESGGLSASPGSWYGYSPRTPQPLIN